MGERNHSGDTDSEAEWEKPVRSGDPGVARAIPKSSIPIIRPVMKAWSAFNVWVYRLSAGRLLGSFMGAPVCLVTMTGCKSGKIRTIPLIYLPRNDDVILVASQGGMDTHPVWYHNLVANPEVEIQHLARRRKLRARRASDEEKRNLWPHILSIYKDFDSYQQRTARNIPIFICSPH
ncbi:MAG: nitroreductase family deazaflavin-dependent oxidoreductase [Deltaproteobacteria bacterium]|nr:nitroreductase family deazaflavin-dependent oxidoreductase [Deltaproteobacteria bacterium]MBW2725688.1 nitroreductase family deazaflavin-dependent oxidoreductase [Deltaproteobacteria bacterium]